MSLLPSDVVENPVRLRILLAGIELFGARGYHGTSIRDVAAAAGLTSASLYAHFTAKEAILAEIVFVGHDYHHRTILTALLEAGPDPRDQLVSVVRAHVIAHCRYPHLAVVSNFERRHLSPEAWAPAAALRDRSSHLAGEIVDRGVAQGVFDVGDRVATLGTIGALGTSVGSVEGLAGTVRCEVLAEHCTLLALRIVGAAPR